MPRFTSEEDKTKWIAIREQKDDSLVNESSHILEEISEDTFANIDFGDSMYGATPTEKINACLHYLILGSSIRQERYTGVKANTLRKWKTTASWWPEVIKELKKLQNEYLERKLTLIMTKAADSLLDRIENGDTKLTARGEKVVVPLGAKDLAFAGIAVPYDKRALMRGDPTSRTERVTTDDTLAKIAKQFEDFTKKLEDKNRQTPRNKDFELILNENGVYEHTDVKDDL